MKDDIANDFEWSMNVISGTINGLVVCISKIQHIIVRYVTRHG